MTIHWPKLTMLSQCQESEATVNARTCPGSSRARSKDPPLRSQIHQPSKLEKSPFNDIEGLPVVPTTGDLLDHLSEGRNTPEDLASVCNRIAAIVAPRSP